MGVELHEIVVEELLASELLESAGHDAETILKALSVRKDCLGSMFMSREEATHNYMDATETIEEQREAERLLAIGHALFDAGWRIARTERFGRGLHFWVPEGALIWRLITSGYIAMHEQTRVEWVTHVSVQAKATADA